MQQQGMKFAFILKPKIKLRGTALLHFHKLNIGITFHSYDRQVICLFGSSVLKAEYCEEPRRNRLDIERLESIFALQLRRYLEMLITV